jgi:DNA-binding NarL/FixJ family response regulator
VFFRGGKTMRVALSKRGAYQADVYCIDGNAAKKTLKENPVSVLAVDFYLKGRDSGKTVLEWAREKQLLPQFVVITESDRNKRVLLALVLTKSGYSTLDGATFVRQ